MKDFDFDELDRAVSSVLTQKQPVPPATDTNDAPADDVAVPQTSDTTALVSDGQDSAPHDESPAQDTESFDAPVETSDVPTQDTSSPGDATYDTSTVTEPDQSTAEMTDQSQPVDQPADAQASEAESQSQDHDELEPQEPAVEPTRDDETVKAEAAPRRGRFMDVVPPSVDMTSHASIPVRSGVTLTPSADFVADAVPDQHDEPATPPAPEPTVDEEIIEPSPGEMPQENPETSEPEPETTLPAEETDESSSAGVAMTPFIPDVPVEKRPLNSLSTTDQAPVVAESAPVATPPLPKELDEEVMAVEANEAVGPDSQPATEPSPVMPEVAATPDTPVAAASIAPQYHTPEDKADATAHPAFDAASYQQPLHDAHKSKLSPAVIIVIVAVLLLIGAALGVLYFLSGR